MQHSPQTSVDLLCQAGLSSLQGCTYHPPDVPHLLTSQRGWLVSKTGHRWGLMSRGSVGGPEAEWGGCMCCCCYAAEGYLPRCCTHGCPISHSSMIVESNMFSLIITPDCDADSLVAMSCVLLSSIDVPELKAPIHQTDAKFQLSNHPS